MRYLRDVRPLAFAQCLANRRLINAERLGDCALRFAGSLPGPNSAHGVVGQLRVVVQHALFAAVASHVCVVLLGGAPVEVGQFVVPRTPIAVQGLVPGRAGTNEGFQDQTVNLSFVAHAVSHQRHKLVPVLVARPRDELPPLAKPVLATRAARPDCSVVASAVAVKIGDRSILGHSFNISHIGGELCAT
jgi:hypothetical protein